MGITKTMRGNLLAKLALIWGFSLIVAYIVSTQSAFTLVQIATVLAMLGTLGIFFLQFHETTEPLTPPSVESVDTDEETDAEESSSSRGEPTVDLSPSELRAQNELIKTTFQAWKDNPVGFSISRQAPHLIQDVAESLEDVDEDIVKRSWRLTIDDDFFKRLPGGNMLRLTPQAVWRAEALGEDHYLDEAIRDEILDVLFQAYRENPSHSPVGRDELLDALARSEDEVDQNVWWLQEKRYVETNNAIGINAGYFSVEITDLGRKITQ